jgi:hypothetical protein
MSRALTIIEQVDDLWHRINLPDAAPIPITGGTYATTVLMCLIDLAYIEHGREIDFTLTHDGYAVTLGPPVKG